MRVFASLLASVLLMAGATAVRSTTEPPYVFEDPNPFGGAAWNIDGTRLAAWSATGLHLLNLETGTLQVRDHAGFRWVRWSPDGVHVSDANRVIDTTTGDTLLTLADDDTIMAWSVDGARLLVQSRSVSPRVVDARSGETRYRFDGRSAVWDAASTRTLVLGEGRTARVYDDGELSLTLALPDDLGSAQSGAWSPDGEMILVAGGGEFALYDASAGTLLGQATQPALPDEAQLPGDPCFWQNYAWSSGGEHLLSFGPQEAPVIWNRRAKPVQRFEAAFGSRGAGWNADGSAILTVIGVLDASTGGLLLPAPGEWHTMRFSADGRHIYGVDAGMALVLDAASGEMRLFVPNTLERPAGGCYPQAVAPVLSPDGRFLAAFNTTEQGASLTVWQVSG